MSSLLADSFETYTKNIKLVFLFSIPFIIAFLIPLLAPLPTYVSSGAIFLRTASIFLNISSLGLAVIVISSFLSLLFLSFAFVAISLIVKAERTYTKHMASVLREVEKYTGRVFVILLLYAAVLTIANIVGYFYNVQDILTPIVGFFLFMAIFYAPTAIVIDNKGIGGAISRSVSMVLREPQLFILWFLMIIIVVSLIDLVFIYTTGTIVSGYLLLVVNSLFVLPYFIIYQAEAYMKRFSILKRR